MKKIIFFFSLLAILSVNVQRLDAQGYAAAGTYLKNSPGGLAETWVQLLNTSNVYNNIFSTQSLQTSLMGSVTDSTAAAATVYLQTTRFGIPKTNLDTLLPAPLANGFSYISAYFRCWKITGTDTVTVSLVESLDGLANTWTLVPGTSSTQLIPTSLTVPLTADFTVNTGYFPILKSSRHYALKAICNTGGNTGTVVIWGTLKENHFDPNSGLH